MGGETAINTDAANLRTDLDYLLGEHLILAAKATGAALDGRSEEFEAYGGLLNTNGTDLGGAIGSVYGAEAEDEWNRIWSAHNGFFVDYTTGVATDDTELADGAVEDLTTIYVPEFSAFL
ncbi:MAG: copper amine oxidase, partial [Chloroflexi bacterium]|nr:copper amine oxidase [Chloroflexota bacterium]